MVIQYCQLKLITKLGQNEKKKSVRKEWIFFKILQNQIFQLFIFNWHFLFSMLFFGLCLDKTKPIPMKLKYFNLH